uniref:RNA helicase n=1 Tax=Zooxanthella nutricula TaxID=1333877 RepID=A0A7S2ILN2_9DINO|mmetsp:Transcript_19512/g.58379  ORF Transcript_19512/g.58379 Transcript_19512/m.58379 type:complete len:439 (+) Transcript_19512:550-1866(+)
MDIEVLAGKETIPKPVTTFVEAAMPDWLLEGVTRKGFSKPTPIQVQVWPVALQGRDLIGIAETGSGKTLAYLLPMMIHIMAQEELTANEGPIGVVMCPTRELAIQIDSVAKEFFGQSGLRSTCVYGGAPVREQGNALMQKVDIVVATPGRFIQLLNEGWTNLNRVTYVVLDEADEMLNRGFDKQVRLILSQIRPDRQMLMFSATWPKEVQSLAKEYCTASEGMEPVFIRIGGEALAACKSVNQSVLHLTAGSDKFDKVREAIMRAKCEKRGSRSKCLIFCKTKAGVDDLTWRLSEHRIEALGMHSDKTQEDRIHALTSFRDGDISVLVATDCLGRGHDIPRVKFVINHDAPENIEAYVHRIGRTGRAGETGYAMTFITDKDFKLARPLAEVLKQTNQKVPDKLQELADQYGGAMSAGEAWDSWGGPSGGSGGYLEVTQ